MGVAKMPPSTTVCLKFHLPCLFPDVVGPVSIDGAWNEARLLSATSIEVAGCVLSCSGLQPIHAVTEGSADDDAASIHNLAVRLQRSLPGNDTSANLAPRTPLAAEAWAELAVKVRPNANVCSNPVVRPAWRVLLPSLAVHTREGAPAMSPLSSPLLTAPVPIAPAAAGESSKQKGVLEVRALEAVYASLNLGGVVGRTREGGDHGMRGVCSAVGPGPGAAGLNALPVAVVIRGE